MSCVQPTDMSIIVDIQSLAEWCGIAADKPTAVPPGSTTKLEDVVSALHGLMVWAQCAPSDHFRMLASLTPDDYNVALSTLQINGAPPGLAIKGAFMLFHRTARRICNLEELPDAEPVVPVSAAASGSSGPSTGGSRPLNTPTISMGKVVDQKLGDEITYLPDDKIVAYHAHYYSIMEDSPSPHVAVTTEQLAAITYLVKANKAPYADFAIFGPHSVA